MPILSSSVHFRIRKPGASRTWLPYFLAAFGAGVAVADEELLRYHWVMPEAAPEKATRVIRVSGEKGERFEEVYAEETLAELKQNPAIMEARIARQAALRREALELARQLREEGKDPLVAYEEAWTQVYSRSWLSGGWLSGSCKLEDMLRRMASEGEEQELTEEERQWLLEALLEDDDRLESEAGQELLRRLAAQLRQKGYGFSTVSSGLNDELMQRFAAGLQHQTDSMDAYRDALFKTRRGQIMTHSLVGYRAPWGMGVGGGAYYRQAPQQVETTEGSGNTQMPAQPVLLQEKKEPIIVHGLNDVPEAVTDFLATAPPSLEEEDNDEKEKEEDDDFLADDESESEAAAPAMMMMRSFSMRSAAYAVQNEGEADAPESPDSPVHGGVVELAQDEILDVGANRVVGGSLAGGRLENVQMVVTGELYRPVSKDYVTVHNLITSADGTNPGILTDVTLYAGTSTEYATLHNITFAGQSELTGYITFEKTQATSDMSVAAGGTLTLKNLTFDLRGVSMDEKTLFVIEDGGTLEGWNAYNVHFVYSGVKVNSAAVALSERKGVIVLSDDHNGNLYWNGAADNMWSVSSKNWSSTAGGAVYEEFTALSNVIFGKDAARDARAISVAQDMVVADLYVTDGGYSFSGARVAVLGDAKFTHESGTVTFNDHLVVQGNLTTGDRERAEYADSVALLGGATIVKDAVFSNLTTTIGGDMTVGGDLNVLSGNLTITGNVTAKEMELVVNGGSASVSGNLTTTTITENKLGSITIGGTAEQRYTGTVTAGDLTVNTQKNDVYFSRLQVDKLTVGEGATVHVQTSSDSVAVSSSKFPVIDLTGTLVLDAPGVTYNDRHSVYVKSDAAKLKFDSGCTVEDLQIFGMADNSGDFNYTDLAIEVTNSSSATVTKMQALGTLEVTSGSLTVKDATGAVHGKLILDKAKLKLGAGADDIMADGSGAVELKNGARLDIGSTTQTLSAGNAISLSGASSITGAADGGGLKLRDDSLCVNYENTGNSIDANLTVAAGQTITLNSASANSSLEISGSISGSGDIVLGNSDSETENVPGTVVLYGANTGFKGKVTVYDGSTLTLLNTEALSNASGVVLEFGGTLALNAPGAVNLNALTFKSGSSLSISSIVGTDAASSKDAVLNVNDNSLKLDNVVLNLNFSQELQSMQTYNIMTGVSSIDNLSFNVTHNNDVKLDVSQYKVVLDGNLLYIHTMMGNVWDGSYSENWTLTGNGGNWSGDEYQQGEGVKYTAAIFGDLTTDGQTQSTETVKVKDEVSPGNVYFTADTTAYQLDSDGGGLAAGTRIHKLGKADVTLGLANNATEGTALGNVDIQAGSLILGKGLAVKGTVTVEKDANLQLKYGSGGLTMFAKKDDEAFSVSAIGEDALLRGVTMDAAGIRGTKDVYNAAIEDDIKAAEINASNLLVQGNAELQYLILKDFAAAGNVTLSDVTLTSSSTATTLTGVTIGSGVKVDASGSYILSGKNLTFDSALTNKGTVTLDIVTDIDNENLTIIEIGKINYDTRVDTYGNTEYVYEFISSTNGGVLYAPALSADNFSINGVNLGSGLKDKDGVKFTDNRNGSITLSIYDGTVSMPQWDERWGKTKNAPAFSRRYESTATDTFTQASGIGGDAKYVSLAWGIVVDATKQSHDATYFKYGSIVNETNAKRVNDGKAIVVTLTSDAKGDLVVGGNIAESEAAAADHEVWIYDSSGVRTIIGGLTNNKIDPGTSDSPGSSVTTPQTAATHILVDSKVTNDKIHVDGIPETDYAKEYIIGGSRWCNQDAESFVTVKSGHIYNIFGGSCGGWHGQLVYDNYGYVTKRLWGFENGYVDWTVWVYDETLWRNVPYLTQTGTAHVYVDGGTVGEIFAGGFYANIIGTQKVEGKERPRAVEMVLTGGTIGGPDLRVFGGTDHGVVTGDIYVRMEGSANVTSILVGGSNAGVVKGDVVLDLISGTANKVEAPGKGWDEGNDLAQIYGDVLVNLYSGFKLGKGIIEYNNPNVDDLECGIFGGMEQSNHVKILKE
ncbi:MAG: hypothetical protein J6R92_07575, partial [Akkermansia sp.]|nr:hypothetical protein [Akkermansia sp.]